MIWFPAYKINRGTQRPRHNIASLQGIMRIKEPSTLTTRWASESRSRPEKPWSTHTSLGAAWEAPAAQAAALTPVLRKAVLLSVPGPVKATHATRIYGAKKRCSLQGERPAMGCPQLCIARDAAALLNRRAHGSGKD